MNRPLTLEQINDIADTKAYPVTVPSSEDVYASMMQQLAHAEGHRRRAPAMRPATQTDRETRGDRLVEILRKHGKPMGRHELARVLGIKPSSVPDYARIPVNEGVIEYVNKFTQKAGYQLVKKWHITKSDGCCVV